MGLVGRAVPGFCGLPRVALAKGQGLRSGAVKWEFRISDFGIRIYQEALTSTTRFIIEVSADITMKFEIRSPKFEIQPSQ